jgi:hypothetical protein
MYLSLGVLTFGRDHLFLFVRYSYLQVSLPLFNTFLILLRIIPSLPSSPPCAVITPPNPNPLSRSSPALTISRLLVMVIENNQEFAKTLARQRCRHSISQLNHHFPIGNTAPTSILKMKCQKCRQPVKLHGSLEDMSPAAFNLLVGLPSSFSPRRRQELMF